MWSHFSGSVSVRAEQFPGFPNFNLVTMRGLLDSMILSVSCDQNDSMILWLCYRDWVLVTVGTFLGSCVNLPQICCVSISASPMPGRSVWTLPPASHQPAAILVWIDGLFGPLSQMSIFNPWCPSEGCGRLCMCRAFPLSLDQAVQSISHWLFPEKTTQFMNRNRYFLFCSYVKFTTLVDLPTLMMVNTIGTCSLFLSNKKYWFCSRVTVRTTRELKDHRI